MSLWAVQWRHLLHAQWWSSLGKTGSCEGWETRCGHTTMPFYKSTLHPHSEYSSQGRLSHLSEDINERVKGQWSWIRGIRIGDGGRGEKAMSPTGRVGLWMIRTGYYRDAWSSQRDQGRWGNGGLPKGQGRPYLSCLLKLNAADLRQMKGHLPNDKVPGFQLSI